jgi:predicted GIY-YIG superfamily endonuclease
MNKPKTALYRHYNANGDLLYVGVSVSTMKRLAQHKKSPWVHDITRIDIQYFEDREDALKAEKEVIKAEKPLFNKAHKPRPLSLVEEIYELISNSTEEELRTTPIYFKNPDVYFAFLGMYSKYAKRMEREKQKTNARPTPPVSV